MGTIKKILKKKNNVAKLALPDFKIYYKPTINKILLYRCQKKKIDQRSRVKSSEMVPSITIQEFTK